MRNARILIVEDEGIIAADLEHRLQRMGHSVSGIAANAERAVALAVAARPDLVLMDIILQGPVNGIEAARQLARLSDVPVIYLTSHADDATVRSAVGTEPFGYVLKPFNERELQAAIQIALYKHHTEAKLRKMERWLAATVASMGDGIIATDRQGRITLINPLAQRLTGWTEDEALGQPFAEVFHVVDERSGTPQDDLVDRAIVEGFNIGLDEHLILKTRDGAEIAVDDSIAPIRDAAGEPSGVVIVFRDGTARKAADDALQALNRELESRVQMRTEQLNESNRALASFSLSVAHDLRSPLFALSGFSDILSDRYAATLDDEGRNFLRLIRNKSLQMSRMIDDYLRLARLRQSPLIRTEVDNEALVGEVLRDLQAQYPAARNVVVGSLPKARGDEGLLRQVWANLLGNALKFTARRDTPRVEVSGEREESVSVFHVQDNGAGFDPARAGRLFTMFQRLHPDSEFAGTGVGLATVAAVIHRHGGTIRAEAEVGRGATFHFTLPQAAPVEAD